MKLIILLTAIVLLAALGWALLVRPSNTRDWAPDQAELARVEEHLPFVTIRNMRNFSYRSETDYERAYYDKTLDLRQLDSAWFFVEPFGKGGAAHTFVSFGFGDRDFVAISVEIRKEKGESFSALRGLLRRYEIMYVVGDERDLVKLRTNYRNDLVYLYRIRSTPERLQKTFLSMLRRAEELRARPEFYNTLTNNCTNNLVRHVNEISPRRVPFSPAVLLSASSDRLAYDLGLIDTDRSFEETKNGALINDSARHHAEDAEFSRKIRGLP
jgi:hypothetical protein